MGGHDDGEIEGGERCGKKTAKAKRKKSNF
ncbi:predicted protein [Sclerotinia sclerotiorum 1980 UF-70]|uniref:Uncharacterized protein n=1 Tax=Sclerotinia sclerotiorum (strain ATCC 18683 / 1980 / Ss-1) TaxID=665079 RepID=A7EJM3_SCLS1|nr:predicted protein [Sclerotinia sclerotiorum 1980 UF-70]EDO03039.1 predicted protein [Sclerotinia sclerotiorum 1980 UF-70]